MFENIKIVLNRRIDKYNLIECVVILRRNGADPIGAMPSGIALSCSAVLCHPKEIRDGG